jgi:hypothetical protein
MSSADPTAEVFVDDARVGLFHRDVEAAGPNAAAFTRAQAELLGFRRCPDCYLS